jgi:DNA-binding winged helix-turn-helix (wHTH) protein/Tol biopolymer transport system component
MGPETGTLYRFDGFELDPANRVFTAGAKPVAIPARAFDLLLYMAGNAQRLLTKEELMKAVWGDMIVEEGNLTQNIFLLRKVLSTNQATENKLIVTVPGRGYRFAARVEVISGQTPAAAAPEDSANEAIRSPAPVVEETLARRRRPSPGRWVVIGAVLALAVAILFFARLRWQANKPIPMPHAVARTTVENPVITVAVSPQGTYLAYADPQSITIQTLRSGETRSIPVGSGVTPVRVVWYPDETRVLISERVNDSPGLYTLSILSGKLSPLRENALSPAVSPDGSGIFYLDGTLRALWLMDGNGENPRRILSAPAPDKLYPQFWSPDGRRVWFVRVHWDKDKEIVSLETCDLTGTRRSVALSDNRTRAFRLLPRGRLIYALVEGSQNFTNLWELPVNAAEGKAEGKPRKLTNWTNFSISGISATADGKQVALLNGTMQADVYVGDLLDGGAQLANTRRLTLNESDDTPAFWTADDQAVVFDSTRNGRSQLFRQRPDQAVPELLSMDSEDDQYARFGGPWIYFHSIPLNGRISWNQPLELRRIPANGGASNAVIRDTGIDIGCAYDRPEICALARLTGKTLAFYRFDHAKGRGAEIGRMEVDSRLFPSFGVSPDGSEVAVIDPKGIGNRIRRIPLAGGNYSEVEVSGRNELETLYWAADGKGWFVSSVTPSNGEYLLHVNARGESQVLFEQIGDGRDTWGIPSHDGKHLAFLRWTDARNVWMIDDF